MTLQSSVLSFAQRIRIRLFLEGVELPVISASITGAPNSPAMCSLQLPPLVEGTRLLPRTLVHLFYLDPFETANPYVTEGHGGAAASLEIEPEQLDPQTVEATDGQKPPEYRSIITPAPCGDTAPKGWSNRRYKLCFGGEVVGFTWTKTPLNRSLILQCEDWSNYWDYAYQWSNTGLFGPGQKAIFSGGATNLFTDFLSSQGSMLTAIVLQGKCNSFPKLQGLAAGIIRLVEAVGGSYYTPSTDPKGNSLKKFAGQNIFFSSAELRLHITQMLVAYEEDPTSKRLLSRNGYGGMFNRALGGLGEQVSIRKAINAISQIMFHETYPQPCPYYRHGTGTDSSGTRRVRLKDDRDLAFFATQAELTLRVLENVKSSLAEKKEDPLVGDRSFQQALRGSLAELRTRIQNVRTALQRSLSLLRSRGAPEVLVSIYQMAARSLLYCEQTITQWRPANEAAYANKTFEKKLDEAITQLRRVPNLTFNTLNLASRNPPRLVQHILRPDIWFGAPPRCNVLFPDMYEQISYQTAFLQEPTRFLLKTNDEFFGEDFLFDRFYFAPQAGSLKADQARLRDVLKNDLLDHELFTGILPVCEKMGEFNIFAARSNQEQAGKVAKVSFAQRSANFIYFKHRFNARQFQVSGRFMPHIALGFPGVIIDKWVDQGAAEQIRRLREEYITADPEARNLLLPKYTAELMGANFLANFVEVTHQISQEQLRGHTSIRCQYARLVDEGVEFLGVTERVQTVQKRQEGDASRGTLVAAVSAPAIGSLGPNQGRVTNVTEVSDKYVRGAKPGSDLQSLIDNPSGQRLPVYFGGARRAGGNKIQDIRVPIGVPVTLDNIGPVYYQRLVDFLGTEATPTFRAWSVQEEVPRYRLEDVDIPAEEVIRPGWYGDIWSPTNISKVYKSFFGIGAITEPTAILDPRSGAVGDANEDFKRAVEEAETAENIKDAVADAPIVTSLGSNASIQQAVEFLTLTYSYVKLAELDVDEFISAYTWRPVASMIDLFGSEDLAFNENGTAVVTPGAVEGFHSRAFGPYDDVFGLVTPEIETVLGIERGSVTAQRADTRKRKLERVQKLSASLSAGRAQVG
jgi:hypothetical protein